MIAAEKAGDMPTLIDAMNTRGTVLPYLDRTNEGIALLRESLRLAEMLGLPYPTLRAINNLALVESANGIAAIIDLGERGYELAQRVMHGGLLVRMATSAASTRFEQGRFDEAIEVLGVIDPGKESTWAAQVESQMEFALWTKTGDPDHLRRTREANQPSFDAIEPQYRSSALDFELSIRWLEGKFAEVVDLAPQIDPTLPSMTHWHDAVSAAIRLGDSTRLRTALDLVETEVGRRFEVLRFAGATGLELLEGDPDQAAVMFVELCDRLEEVESPRMAAIWRAILAEVMPDRPEARAAAQDAFKWFSDVGARGYLEIFSHVWARQLEGVSLAG
jgi:hypothetical protein